MPLIYKNFSNQFAALNTAPGGDLCVPVPGGRGYLREQFGKTKPYLDEIHFNIHDESWYSQHALRDRIAADETMHGRVYAGCAGMMNLDYAAALRAPALLLFDINPLQALFWQDLTKLIAETSKAEDFVAQLLDFTKQLYYKIEALHGQENLRNMYPPVVPEGRYDAGAEDNERCSPFRGLSYRRAAEWAEYRLTQHEADKNWLGNPARYRHIHELAKHNAIAAVTLDVRDSVACRQVEDALKAVKYSVGTYNEQKPDAPVFAEKEQQGTAIGFLYRSNVGHYLRWNKAEIAKQVEAGQIARDFTGLAADTGTYRKAHDNLRRWMAPDAHMIASDRHTGGAWGQFIPRLTAIKGLAPVPQAG
jgi:hypothetical protein